MAARTEMRQAPGGGGEEVKKTPTVSLSGIYWA